MRKPTVSRLISIGVAVLCLAVPANTLVQPVAAAARGFFELSTTVPRTISPVGQNDYIFRTVRVEIDYRGGPVRLSSTPDGSGSIVTDDSMTLNVEKLKGKRSLTIDFSRNCVGLERRPPQDITNLFRRGVNKVTLLLRDRCGVAYSSDPYFLVGDLWARNLLIEDQLGRGRNPGTFGDPVNTSIGNFHREETDLAFSTSVYGMDLVRTYNALDDEVGALGQGWSTSFEATLLDEDGGAVSFRDTDARTVIFTPEGPGFRRPAQFFADLGQNGDGTRTIEWPGQESWRFDSQGRLVEKRNWDGQTVRIAFTDDRLTSVAGPSGTGITFAYDASGKLTSAASSDGRRVAYGYGPGGLLETVIDVTGATTSYGYDDNGRLRSVRDADGKDRVSVTYDAGGRVAKQVNADGGTASFSYDQGASATTVEDGSTHTSLRYRHDPAGQLLELTDPFGAASSRSYDGEGNLASAARRGGGGVEQTFDAHGNVLTRTIGGATVTFAYDSLDRVVSSTDAWGAVTRYTYDGSSRVLASRQDPTGGVTRFESTAGRITAVTDPDGVATHFGYDPAGNVTSVTDGAGATTRYTYDAAGRRLSTVTPLGSTETSEYDAAGRLLSLTDGVGATTRFTYSPAGRLLELTDPAGARSTFTYNDAGRLASETDADGAQTQYRYDDAGNLTSRTEPDGSVTRYEYDALSRLVTETDPGGLVTRHTYGPDGEELGTAQDEAKTSVELDQRGNVVTSIDALGAVTRSTYDLADRLLTQVDPTGAERRFRYDGGGRVVAETDPAGATTLRRWTAAGRLAEVQDPLGRVTRYAYDRAGRLARVTDPAGGVTRYEYDPDGRRVAVTSPGGLMTRAAFDAADRQVSATSPTGAVTATQFSLRGEPVSIRSASGAVVRMDYDSVGQLTAVTDANGGATHYAYDRAGRRVSQTDARGGVTRYAYDGLGRETERTDPLGRTIRRRYDSAGRLNAVVLPTGETVERRYDAMNRLTAITAVGASLRYGYDAAGRRISMQDAFGETRYRYDVAGRLVETTEPDGSSYTTSYDAAGQAIGFRYPSGLQVARTYNANGRLVRLDQAAARRPSAVTAPKPVPEPTLPRTLGYHPPSIAGQGTNAGLRLSAQEGSDAQKLTAVFELDPDGRLLSETIPGRLTRRYGYRSGLLASFSETPALHPDQPTRTTLLERDVDGRVVTETTDGRSRRFSYDAAGQLTAVDGEGASRFEYDATGNRTTLASPAGTIRYRYDAAQELVEATSGSAQMLASYDAAGRMVRLQQPRGMTELRYDPFGRLATESRSSGGLTTKRTMEYDGDDLLRSLVITTTQSGSALPQTLAERYDWTGGSAAPNVIARTGASRTDDFVYGYGRTLMAGPEGIAAFSVDVYGSALRTDATKAAVLAPGYDLFGAPTPEPGPARQSAGFGYRGELTIGDKVYLRARWYLPALGRFATIDPEDGVTGTTTVANPYQYADNDPVNRLDPTGRRAIDDDIRVPVDYGRARSKSVRLRFPPQPGRGTVRVGLFIPTETAGLPGVNALRSHGDNRGPSPYADLSRHRAVATVGYETGQAEFRVNPSCGLGGPPGDCHDPLPIIDNFSRASRLFQRIPLVVHDSNRVKLEAKRGGAIKIRWAILNADKRVLAPAIDGSVTLHDLGPRAVCIEYHRDAYPALEAYQYLTGEPPRDLLHQDAAWNADRGLLPLPFTDKDGTTCPSEKEWAPGPIARPGGAAI